MGDFTPWAFCIGVFLIYPLISFVIGFYLGRKGMPFSVQIQRKADWGRTLSNDEYGLGVAGD